MNLLNPNHWYDYKDLGSPIEERFLNHLIKFLHPDTKLFLQYQISTISGNFLIDIALSRNNRIIGLECDGVESHTKDKDDWYDEWRDTLCLFQHKLNAVYRIWGRDIMKSENIPRVIYMLYICEPEHFNQTYIGHLPSFNYQRRKYKIATEYMDTNENGEQMPWGFEIRIRALDQDFDSFWIKYIIHSLLYEGKKVGDLIRDFSRLPNENDDLLSHLNEKHPHLQIKSMKEVLSISIKE